jgi:hypothetical protein
VRDAIVVIALDAAVDPPGDVPVDAPFHVPPGAGHRRTLRPPVDARSPTDTPIDASNAAPNATPPNAAQGTGTLTAKSKGETYLSVVLDGSIIGPTPMFRRVIPAGTHTIELVEAKTSKVVVHRVVTISDGDAVTVVEP